MKTYSVYRFDYPTNKTKYIGTVVDRRKRERKNSVADMMRLAQKLFATSSIDSHIYILPSKEVTVRKSQTTSTPRTRQE
jgi:hypothetical protein